MRKKELKLVVTFHTTADAMAMEKACKEQNVPGRIYRCQELFPQERTWRGAQLSKERRRNCSHDEERQVLKKKTCTNAWYKKKEKDGHFESKRSVRLFRFRHYAHIKLLQQMFVKHVVIACCCILPMNICL